MEPEAAEVMWKQSLELHNIRYTTFVRDGDSKAHDRVVPQKPCGEEVEIRKEECMNHVEKRMGTALRNLVQDCKKRGITLGGRQPGSLTDAAIKKLTTYYGRAILCSDTVEDMQRAIWATLHHCSSTDDNPRHQFCPVGENSWCFFLNRHRTTKVSWPPPKQCAHKT
ncbi:hypothetical protein ElyMa_001700700 [Elysia marginata]|uniref:Mutator-like transposase domain-containing protein n=1 Tax=Elysia marginata TaxID=1093978 RepID=A0AAV4JUB1_9GAST|nr:hypothetical protein ElyMa_001700700 [Elysia marginata]